MNRAPRLRSNQMEANSIQMSPPPENNFRDWSANRLMTAYAKTADNKTLMEIFHRYNAELLRYFKRKTKNNLDAEDLLQQMFEKVITGAKTFEDRGPDSAEKWLYRIGRNCLIDHYRKQKREQDKRGDVEQQFAKHQRGSGQEDEEGQVLGALQQIPDGAQQTHKPRTITPEQTVHSQRIEKRFYECLEILPTEQRDVLHLTGIIGGMGKMKFV